GSPRWSYHATYSDSRVLQTARKRTDLSNVDASWSASDVDSGVGSSAAEFDTLMPMPTTASAGRPAESIRSTRIPATLCPPMRTSFGHFNWASTLATFASASATATPASSGNHGQRPLGTPSGSG